MVPRSVVGWTDGVCNASVLLGLNQSAKQVISNVRTTAFGRTLPYARMPGSGTAVVTNGEFPGPKPGP